MKEFTSRFFLKEDFACRDGCEFDDISQELVDKLDDLRDDLGEPIRVTRRGGGCRCEKYNEEVGGKKNSAHLKGEAADITADNIFTLKELAPDYFVRIGYGKTFIHVDVSKDLPQKSWEY